jgi:hypothetical protein
MEKVEELSDPVGSVIDWLKGGNPTGYDPRYGMYELGT